MASLRSRLSLLVVCLAFPSCQSEGETGPGLDALPVKLAALACEALPSCLGPLFTPVLLNGLSCPALYEASLAQGTLPVWQKAVLRGTLKYHPNKVEACLAAIQSSGCGFWQDHAYLPECEAALEGTVAEGKECLDDSECVGDRYCQVDLGCPGHCAARVAATSACKEDGNCQPGMVCFNGTCASPLPNGATCQDNQVSCKGPLMCMKTGKAQSGTCGLIEQSRPVGETCEIEGWKLCAGEGVCALTGIELTAQKMQLTCQAKVEATASCHIAFPSQCPSGTYCTGTKLDALPLKFEGTCADLPGPDQPCATNTTFPPVCGTGLVCVDKLCVAKVDLDAPCRFDEECFSGKCASKKCVPKDPCYTGTPAPK